MNNDDLLKLIDKIQYISLDINKIKKVNFHILNSINKLQNDIIDNQSKTEEYLLNIDNKINFLSNKIKEIEEQGLKDSNLLDKHINYTKSELLKLKENMYSLQNNNSSTELNDKISELEKLILESSSDLFDTIDSLENEFDDFKDDIETKIEDILETSNINFNNLYDSVIQNLDLDFSDEELYYNELSYDEKLNNSNKTTEDLNIKVDTEESLSLRDKNNNSVSTDSVIIKDSQSIETTNTTTKNNDTYIEEPKKYITIKNLETFNRYKDIIDLYDLETKYIFLGIENQFNNYKFLLINVIKILNNKYRSELLKFIKREDNKLLYEGIPLNLPYTSDLVSLNEIYGDLAGDGNIYISIPENNTDILYYIFLILSHIEDINADVTFNFVFNENNKVLYEMRMLDIYNNSHKSDNSKDNDNLISIIPSDYYERTAYYPSKKQMSQLEKLLKNNNYDFKVKSDTLSRKDVTSLINILEKNEKFTNSEEDILYKFLKKNSNVDSINNDYFTKLVLDGYTIDELCNIFRVSPNTINKKKKELGLLNIKKSAKDSIDNEYFRELCLKNYTCKMLAKEFNVSESIINNKKKELGLVKNLENLKNYSELRLENISYKKFTNTIPIKLYINNSEIDIENNTWVETYLKMCNYLIDLDEIKFKQFSSKLRYMNSVYFSNNPSKLRKGRELSNSNYYAETGLNVYTLTNNIRFILNNMGLSEDIFYIEFIEK